MKRRRVKGRKIRVNLSVDRSVYRYVMECLKLEEGADISNAFNYLVHEMARLYLEERTDPPHVRVLLNDIHSDAHWFVAERGYTAESGRLFSLGEESEGPWSGFDWDRAFHDVGTKKYKNLRILDDGSIPN